MGLVYKANQNMIQHYDAGTASVDNALITPGQDHVVVKVAEVDAEEVQNLLQKVDAIANSYENEAIAVAYAEVFPVILTAMRMVKEEAKAPFKGITASGTELDAVALIPENVGGGIMCTEAVTTNLGLFAGTAAGVYTWLSTVGTVATAEAIVPQQTMSQYAAMVHIGAIDTVAVPKYNRIKFELSGVPTPAQSTLFNIRGVNGTAPFIRFQKPVLVGPLKKQRIYVDPNIAGDSKFELMTVLIARADVLTM
jgi:hypothetical protein